MSPHDQTKPQNYYFDWYMHSNNQYCYNRLIFRKGYKNYKNTKIRILESKTDEGWSYERCSDYKTTGYQFFIDEKVEVIEIRNQNTSRALILRQRKLLCVHLGLASHET